ncbi:MAG: chromosomal replication initiator protein DnaA [Rikenellaceae bacterium]
MTSNQNIHNEMWHNCLKTIREQVSNEEFNRWLKPVVPLDFDGEILRLRVPSEEYVMYIETNFMSRLRPIICSIFGNKIRLKYSVPNSFSQQNSDNATSNSSINNFVAHSNGNSYKNPFVIPGVKKMIVDPQLCFDLTFENFIEGECNRLARSASWSVAMNPGNTSFNPIFIYGDSGLGKTHIAQAIGIEVKKRFPEKNVLYVTANKFQTQYQNATLKGEINDFVLFYQMMDVLIIDDIQEFASKPGTQNVFFNIFNHLHLSKKQIVLTADKSPVELNDIMERLITRFKWSLSVKLSSPDYQTKCQIIRKKFKEENNMAVNDDVVDFLANSIKANVREVEGAVSLFIANTKFLNTPASVELARKILEPYVKIERREITSDIIIDVICNHFSISKEKLLSSSRSNDIATPRQTAMYFCKKYTQMSLKAIGGAIGGKNHATVVHAHNRISDLYETDKNFRQTLDEIEMKLR